MRVMWRSLRLEAGARQRQPSRVIAALGHALQIQPEAALHRSPTATRGRNLEHRHFS